MERGIVFDLKLYSADERIRRNIFGVRTSKTELNGIIDQQSFTLTTGQSFAIPNLPNCVSFVLYSNLPVVVQGDIPDDASGVAFPEMSLLALTSGLNNVTVTNTNTDSASVTLTRLSAQDSLVV